MIFQVTHTHTNEDCPARSVEKLKPTTAWWAAMKKTPGIKVLGAYVSPLAHTYYITVEADDAGVMAKAFGPLVSQGMGTVTPVISMDQAFPIAETGAFAAPK